MSQLITDLHHAAFKDITFDIPYYFDLCKEKRVIELCAGFGRVCNKLNEMIIDISAIELNPYNFNLINLPIHKRINDNIFNLITLQEKFDIVIAPFNSFPIFASDEECHLFFQLISNLLDIDGTASLNYYHPDGWRVIPTSENSILVDDVKYEYTSSFDLRRRTSKHGIWEDIFINTFDTSKHSIKYHLKVYEDYNDVNKICRLYGLECIKTVDNFYDIASFEPGWVEYQLIKRK